MPKLEISRGSFELNLVYRWFTPHVYIVLVFSIFWIVFNMMGIRSELSNIAENPLVAFSLVFLAVGFGLFYYGLCLFLNRTYIDVDQRVIKVHHGPLPWFEGKKEIPVADVQQLYAEQRTGSEEKKYYILRALLKNGQRETLIGSIEAPAESLLELEREVEAYLGIPDAAVYGEAEGKATFTAEPRKPMLGPPRPGQALGYSARPGIELANTGDFITYGDRTFEVAHVTTYDWNNGDVDRLLQLVVPTGVQTLLYIQQDKGLFKTFLEVEFTKVQQHALAFVSPPAPKSLEYEGAHFELYRQEMGRQHVPRRPEGIPVEQYLYFNQKGDEYLRILDHQGMESVYFGQEELPAAFQVLQR